MHQACQDWLVDKADMTHKHNSEAQGLQQLHGFNIEHNNKEPRGCLLMHKDKRSKLADLANSTPLKTCITERMRCCVLYYVVTMTQLSFNTYRMHEHRF